MNAHAMNPMLVATYHDRPSGATAWLIVDTFLHGVAGGGIRMAPDVSESLMKHLAATMSVKLSIVQPPCGGAKCGIRYNSRAADSKEVLHRVVRAFASFLQTCWVTGSDLGTDWNEIVAACKEHAGIPHPQYALMKAYGGRSDAMLESGIDRLKAGTSLAIDESLGLQMSDAVTGWTVCASAEELFAFHGEDLAGKRVAVQGFGAVGGSAAKFFIEAGAVVVAVSDELGAIIARDQKGLDIPGLLQFRKLPAKKIVDRESVRARYDYEFADRDAVLYLPVDILVPAAGSYISLDLTRVQARFIIEGANDPFTEEQEKFFQNKGITVIPDAIANAGSAGLYGMLVAGEVPLERDAILSSLRTQVRKTTRTILQRSSSDPRQVLEDVARSTIQACIRDGHSFLPNGLSASELEELQSDDLQIRYRMTSPYADLSIEHA